jgi:hypothetical protein
MCRGQWQELRSRVMSWLVLRSTYVNVHTEHALQRPMFVVGLDMSKGRLVMEMLGG